MCAVFEQSLSALEPASPRSAASARRPGPMPVAAKGRRARRLAAFAAPATLAAVALLATPLQAQAAPAMHWGAMDLKTSVDHCVGRARKAYFDASLTDQQVTGWQVYGRKADAAVLVTCAPRGTQASYLVVVASSTDSKAAELLRNDVRTRIARMIEFDGH